MKNNIKNLSSPCLAGRRVISHLSSRDGFTLIELIVVLSVAAVLSVIGIAAFVSYNQTQSLNTAAADIANMFSLAKSRAASGVKPSIDPCSTETWDGYRISITIPRTYKLDVVCPSGISNVLTSILPSTISFSTDATFFFAVLTGGFTQTGSGSPPPWPIYLTGFGKNKTIWVDSLGNAR